MIEAWLLSRFGAFGARIAQWLLALLLIGLLVLSIYDRGIRAERAANQAALAAKELADQKALAAALARGDQLAAQLDQAQQATRVEIREVIKEVPRVVTEYRLRPGDDVRPLPACLFTRGYVGLWNRALGAGLDSNLPTATTGTPRGATRTDSPGAGKGYEARDHPVDGPDLLADGIGSAELLGNHIDNAESCRLIRQQLSALIQWHRQNDGPLR